MLGLLCAPLARKCRGGRLALRQNKAVRDRVNPQLKPAVQWNAIRPLPTYRIFAGWLTSCTLTRTALQWDYR